MVVGFPGALNQRTALKRAGALAVALGALEASGHSLSPRCVSALPSSRPTSRFDISAFLPVPPQNYGSDVQFQLPPAHTVFLTAALERTPTPAGPGGNEPRAGPAREVLPVGRVAVEDNGLERFLTATRRQNFLVPPRRHRAFPLTELA